MEIRVLKEKLKFIKDTLKRRCYDESVDNPALIKYIGEIEEELFVDEAKQIFKDYKFKGSETDLLLKICDMPKLQQDFLMENWRRIDKIVEVINNGN